VGDGDAGEQLAELLVVADGEEQVARHDAGLLVVLRGVAGQLQDLGWGKKEAAVRTPAREQSGRMTKRSGGWVVTSAARYSRTAAR
jgi:hypothetical protein